MTQDILGGLARHHLSGYRPVYMAEREGFEPSIGFLLYALSRGGCIAKPVTSTPYGVLEVK